MLQGVVVRILLRAIERCLREHSPGGSAAARLGAVVFIHRFGSSLNAHLHFHSCILDGVFAPAGAADTAAGVVFHEVCGLDVAAVATVQAQMRQRVLRACVRRGLLAQSDGEALGGWDHGGGFSLDATVRIEGADRAGRERLLRYCARPPLALDHLHQHDAEHLRYDIAKPRPDGSRALVLTPLALLDKIAALVPPPRVHRHLDQADGLDDESAGPDERFGAGGAVRRLRVDHASIGLRNLHSDFDLAAGRRGIQVAVLAPDRGVGYEPALQRRADRKLFAVRGLDVRREYVLPSGVGRSARGGRKPDERLEPPGGLGALGVGLKWLAVMRRAGKPNCVFGSAATSAVAGLQRSGRHH